MAMADYYEGQHVADCPSCGRALVRTRTVTPDGEVVWNVGHSPEDWRHHLLVTPDATASGTGRLLSA